MLSSCIAFPCSCDPLPKLTKRGVQESSKIFEGKIIAIHYDTLNRSKVATFVVTKGLRSTKISDMILVRTSGSGASCGLYFEKGQTWYIFPYEYKGVLRAGLCGRSLQLTKLNKQGNIFSKNWWLYSKYFRKQKKRYHRDKRVIRGAN